MDSIVKETEIGLSGAAVLGVTTGIVLRKHLWLAIPATLVAGFAGFWATVFAYEKYKGIL